MTVGSTDAASDTRPSRLTLAGNGIRFVAKTCGDGPLVLCLHGFPDSAHTFDALLLTLADRGYRAVAPCMRGYAPTTVPARGACDPETLGRDALALADALGVQRFFIIGHDWGAVAAYAAAALAPGRVRGIVTAAVPPLRLFLRNQSPRQLRRSWYIFFFQLRGLADRKVGAHNCALVERLWRSWSPEWDFSAADIAPVKVILANPEARRAALDYYRALPLVLLGLRQRKQRRRLLGRLDVPALVVCGSQDACIGAELFLGVEACFSVGCRLLSLPAGHFVHRECPDSFSNAVLSFLSDQAGST